MTNYFVNVSLLYIHTYLFYLTDIDDSNVTTCNSNYAEKKRKLIVAWEGLRPALITTRIEELSPSTNECCFCNSAEQEIIFCQDCGPAAFYCSSCCERVHTNILFHKPHKWKASLKCFHFLNGVFIYFGYIQLVSFAVSIRISEWYT